MSVLLRSVLLMLACAGLAAFALEPALEDEPAAVRETLKPFKELITRLPPELRKPLLLRAREWVALTPEEQAQLRENLIAWEDREPLERLALRERFEAWEHLDAPTRAAALTAAQRFADLPEEARQAWREQFATLDAAQRQRYLFDPNNRMAMDLANDLFPFVPVAEQVETLTMLRGLTPDQVATLRKTLARLPPPRRHAYRQHLLELDAAARAAELDAGG